MARVQLLTVALLAGALVAQGESPFLPFDQAAFAAHARELGASEAQLESFRRDAQEAALASAADALLRQVSSDYGAAVAAAEGGDPRGALLLAELLGKTRDPWLRAHGRYHLGRVFLDADDPEKAADTLAAYLKEDRNRTPLDAEVLYFYAHALAQIPMPASAARAFRTFLELCKDAPERYRASASQQLAELEAQGESPLHEVADAMQGVERRIRKSDTGSDTQAKQKDVLAQLQKILEQIEELEKQSGGAPSGLGTPSSPATKSAAPPGATRIGNLGRVQGVADRWGNLEDRDREAIESDLQTKLPGHYRRMLEDYYRKLGK